MPENTTTLDSGKTLTPKVALAALTKLGVTVTPEDMEDRSLFAGRGDSYQAPTQVRKLNITSIPTQDHYKGFCRVH